MITLIFAIALGVALATVVRFGLKLLGLLVIVLLLIWFFGGSS